MAGASESLSITASLESLKPATDFVHRGANHAEFSGERMGVLDLVFEELFVNVANYAYPSGTQGTVQITWSVPEPRLLAVELADEGAAFDPFARPDPELSDSLDDRPVGGLGIFLVRQMTRSCEYRREGGRNHVHFRISASADA
jgi:anti-sigma regulatory factor (Ser/Thr protein kinase)